MPELPEVETVARTLAPLIRGRTITGAALLNPGTLSGPEPLERVLGRTITAVDRRAKLVLVHFAPEANVRGNSASGQTACAARDGGASGGAAPNQAAPDRAAPAASGKPAPEITGFAVHLKMSGQLFVYPAGTAPGPHTRALLDLSDGSRLFFDDTRKFGYLRVLSPAALAEWNFWQTLGPEPLVLSAAAFAARLAGRGGGIKALLLDQTVIAGVGNIYADESLFRAGIAPTERAARITPARLRRLGRELRAVLEESIQACGSSIRDYRTARGDTGAFQNAFRVYGRGGQPCVACGALLRAGRVAGRGTTWCPHCQPDNGTTAETRAPQRRKTGNRQS